MTKGLKLNQLNGIVLSRRSMFNVRGGGRPGCSCVGVTQTLTYWKNARTRKLIFFMSVKVNPWLA